MPSAATSVAPPLAVRVFLPFALGFCISFLFRSANAVIGNELAIDFDLSPAQLGFLTSVYFLAFAAMQLPVGVLLDRYGPRRVVTGLLVVATAGAVVFASAPGFAGLAAGRILIGIGVSACLMGAIKALAIWYPLDRLASLTGWTVAFGSLGGLLATAPVEASAAAIGWRATFVVFGGIALAIGVYIGLAVPEKTLPGASESWREQLAAFRRIGRSRLFWRLGLPLVTVQSVFQAMFGLWIVPWLMNVEHMSRADAATWLFWIALSALIASPAFGVGADHLAARKISRLTTCKLGMLLCVASFFAAGFSGVGRLPLLVLYAFGAMATVLSYTFVTMLFPRAMSGRVTTAINTCMFVTSFLVQWGVGMLLQPFATTAGAYEPAGYALVFIVLGSMQTLSLVWLLTLREEPTPSDD